MAMLLKEQNRKEQMSYGELHTAMGRLGALGPECLDLGGPLHVSWQRAVGQPLGT